MLNKRNEERLEISLDKATKTMKKIYGNKNSDEYKMHGDITKSEVYSSMEKLINDLPTLKGFPGSEAKDIKIMFMTLHRPIWKKMVTAYIANPDERNTMYTMYYTLGYRTIRGELARIFASTEATDKGVVYKAGKIGRMEWILRYIKFYNDKLEGLIDKAIAETNRDTKPITPVTEAVSTAAAAATVGTSVNIVSKIATAVGNVFRTAKELRPTSFISALLSRHYDKKVDTYEDVVSMYLATKEAYEDYMRIPASKRDKKIEEKYKRNIEKYNIKMNNLKAKIEHYDSRAMEYGDDIANGRSGDDGSDSNESNDSKKKPSSTKKEPAPKSDDDDDFDF